MAYNGKRSKRASPCQLGLANAEAAEKFIEEFYIARGVLRPADFETQRLIDDASRSCDFKFAASWPEPLNGWLAAILTYKRTRERTRSQQHSNRVLHEEISDMENSPTEICDEKRGSLGAPYAAETLNWGPNARNRRTFFFNFEKGLRRPDWLAGAPGFEPGNGGIKIRCLTTWLRPNTSFAWLKFGGRNIAASDGIDQRVAPVCDIAIFPADRPFRQRIRFQPEDTSCLAGIQSKPGPPSSLIAVAMELAMMSAAKGNGKLVADLAAERALLCKAQMMGVGGYSAADQTAIAHDRSDVLAVTNAPRFG